MEKQSYKIIICKSLVLYTISNTLSQASSVSPKTGLFIGRISEGNFEYSKLNGRMTAENAIKLCDNDEKCGGFTYKGSNLVNREYDIFFFHIVINVKIGLASWKWIFYKTNKRFIVFPGRFLSHTKLTVVKELKNGADSMEICNKIHDCVGVLRTRNSTASVLLDSLDIETFKKSNKKVTLMKIIDADADTKIHSKNAMDGIDTCCPESKNVDTEKVFKTVNDNMPRISCDISKEDFLEQYVKQKVPVILLNCTRKWKAQREWTMANLLNKNKGKLLWRNNFKIKSQMFKEYSEENLLAGSILSKIMENNGTLRIFDPISRRKHTHERKKGNSLDTDKMHLFSDYSAPNPIPQDYFEQTGILTDYQWIIVSHKNTGTELHMDPLYTSPWNTVISGHKWWVLMPPDVLPGDFLCDSSCSEKKDDNLNIYSWFTHVLPQLRERQWYGTYVREFIQGPGETLYIPGNLAHAIMNINDNVSITENFFLVDSLDDWVHGMMAGETLIDDDCNGRVKEKFWKQMYFRVLKRSEREAVRAMIEQFEDMVSYYGEACENL